ncbi:MAG: ATP-grasp domain-containing protein [Pirellulales bacterium]
MSKFFLFEFATGGGLLAAGAEVAESIAVEGAAMLGALAQDFSRLDGSQVRMVRDHRCRLPIPDGVESTTVRDRTDFRQTFSDLANWADASIVIAPEFDGWLERSAESVVSAGGMLLGPSPPIISLTADKHRTAEHLRAAGVPVPDGCLLRPGAPLPEYDSYPAVLKLVDGAGSADMIYLPGRSADWPRGGDRTYRLERYCAGIPASVSFLTGPAGLFPLAPCRQHLSAGDRFAYRGGSLPLDVPLAERAIRLASRALETLDRPRGYLGVDLVLGDATNGSEDVVIEINPRLTTSYVGLRAATTGNLAGAMCAAADGYEFTVSFDRLPVEFLSDGTVTRSTETGRSSATS